MVRKNKNGIYSIGQPIDVEAFLVFYFEKAIEYGIIQDERIENDGKF